MNTPINLIAFLDSAQRTIFGEFVDRTEKTLTIANPVVVNVQPEMNQMGQSTGRMSLQLLPTFFREFLANQTEKIEFVYPIDMITEINIKDGLDVRLYGQYQQIFAPVNQQIVTPPGGGQVMPANQMPQYSNEQPVDLFTEG